MNVPGFQGRGDWYKGNLHSHTTISDGMLTPQESVEFFRRRGYQFLCLSEHDIYTDYRSEFDDKNFIILPGIEASAVLYRARGTSERYKVHHLHGILGPQALQKSASQGVFSHLERVPRLEFFESWDGAAVAQAVADRLIAHGCVVTYNHPVWSRVESDEFTMTQGLAAIEIFNYNTVQESATGYDTTFWDTMLRRGRKINGFASDDNHNEGLFDDACGGWVSVLAPELSHEAIVQAFQAGNYYSSSGPKIIDWGIIDGVAWVNCSPVHKIVFVAGNIINDGTAVLGEPGDNLTSGVYRLKGHETYVRVECVDQLGQTAWSNPIYLSW